MGNVDGRRRDTPLLIVSNRGPVEYYKDHHSGEIHMRRAGGGLATALAAVAKARAVTWVASPVTAADRAVLESGAAPELEDYHRLRLVDSSPEAYKLFYSTFCNPFLWFLQHALWEQLQRPELEAEALHAWEHGYLPVNEAFGEAVVEELSRVGGSAQVMLHDYHLYVVPRVIRDRAPGASLQHFIHIPWPPAQEWRKLPRPITSSICEGLLANDSVVFQTKSDVEHFVATCQAFLAHSRVTHDGAIAYGGRRTRVWANPISVDAADLRARLSSARAQPYREKLASELGELTIVRVDRLDPSKNVLAGFEAFDLLLQRHPKWKGRVLFLAFLVPSRSRIPEYRSYTEDVFALVDAINARHGRPEWTPIKIHHEENRIQALVAMSCCDVLLVNSLRDGMNLVSKEGAIVNERDGVLVLSVTAGSHAELREGALSIKPDDIEQTAQALHTALSMPAEERRRRAALLRQTVKGHDLDEWLRLQLEDLRAIERASSRWGPTKFDQTGTIERWSTS